MFVGLSAVKQLREICFLSSPNGRSPGLIREQVLMGICLEDCSYNLQRIRAFFAFQDVKKCFVTKSNKMA